MQKEPMLEGTYKRLSMELKRLKTVERAEIAKIIDTARELWDLKENAEYHAAKDRQGLMEGRILELTDLTSRAQIIDPSKNSHTRVSFGSTIDLVEQNSDEEFTYTIVGTQESNPSKGRISFSSPMAKALLSKEEGDEVLLKLPDGIKKFDIESIYYKEIYLDD